MRRLIIIPFYSKGGGEGQTNNFNPISEIAANTFGLAAALVEADAARDAQEALQAQQQSAIADNAATRERLVSDARDNLAELFGVVPDQLDLSEQQIQSALTNARSLPQIQSTVNAFNQEQVNSDIERALRFDPNFNENLSQLSSTARSFLRGEIPDDVLDRSIRDRAGLTGVNGVPGTAQEATARDLGLLSLDLQDRGGSIFQQIGQIRDQVSPINRSITNSSFLLDPAAFLQVQDANNRLAASPTPGLGELLGVELQGSANDAAALAGVAVPSTSVLGAGLSSAAGGISSFNNAFNQANALSSLGNINPGLAQLSAAGLI